MKRSPGRPCPHPRPPNLSLDLLLGDGSEPRVRGGHPGDKKPLSQRSECPRQEAVATRGPSRGSPFRRGGGDRPAWATVGAEGRLLANESVFLLKFLAFCRSVLYLIPALAFQAQYSPHSQPGSVDRARVQAQISCPRPEAGKTRDYPCFRPAPPLPPRPHASGTARFGVVEAVVDMALTLSLLLGGRVRAAVARCGFATRGVADPGFLGREPDPDSDWEPEERELQEVERYRLLPGPSA